MSRQVRCPPPRVSSFFAGIGGFDVAFEAAGAETVFQCEIKDFCNTVLGAHWPTTVRMQDINEVRANDIPASDIWAGGFPCQDVSLARGRLGREGLQGARTGLFHTMMELIRQRSPKVVLLENVLGFLSSNDGRDLLTVLDELTSSGYAVAWRVVNTRYFGAPQSRPRIYLCAWMGSPRKAVNGLFEAGPAPMPGRERDGFIRPYNEGGISVPETAFCLAATSGRHTGTDWSRTYVAYHDRVRRITPDEAEGIQGFEKGWTLPACLKESSPEEMDSLRYFAIGNAVSPPVVRWISSRILGEFGSSRSGKFELDSFAEHAPQGHSVRRRRISEMLTAADGGAPVPWATGGVAFDDICVDCRVSPAPIAPIPSRLIDVIDKEEVHERYFLSSNAATGILRRVRKQNRTLFRPLHLALQRLAGENADREVASLVEEDMAA